MSMRNFVVTLAVVVGCGESYLPPPYAAAEPTVEPVVPGCTADDIETTILPSVSSGDVWVMCTVCDVGKCIELGDPCNAYGERCDADGLDGVCVACCNGIVGELHCSPIK